MMNKWDGQAGVLPPGKVERANALMLELLTLVEKEIGSDKTGSLQIEFSLDPTNPTVPTHIMEISKL